MLFLTLVFYSNSTHSKQFLITANVKIEAHKGGGSGAYGLEMWNHNSNSDIPTSMILEEKLIPLFILRGKINSFRDKNRVVQSQ